MKNAVFSGIGSTRGTRFTGLGYRRIASDLWRIVDAATNEVIGPHYASKAELLADIARFYSDWTQVTDSEVTK